MKRRAFIGLASSGAAMAALPSCRSREAAARRQSESVTPLRFERAEGSAWLGTHLWANRLQDWHRHGGQINCVAGGADLHCRTAHFLTRSLNGSKASGRLQTIIHNLAPGKPGFGGFLLGAGGGDLDYRSASLIHYGAGQNGGILAVIDSEGNLSFRDFATSAAPLDFDPYAVSASVKPAASGRFARGETSILLDCHIDSLSGGTFDLRLVAYDAATQEELAFIVMTGVSADRLRGNIALVSSPKGQDGARFGFEDIAMGGPKISNHPERALGPVMGCLHSLNRDVLKMTAQFMPVDLSIYAQARLDYKRTASKTWTEGPTEALGDGFTALFRLSDWDPARDYDYRIVHPERPDDVLFEGQILKDPAGARPLKIALHSCLLPTSRPLDRPTFAPSNKLEDNYDRYDEKSLLFPHKALVENCEAHEPDLYVFLGDQYYETFPTRYGREGAARQLDTLYRWYLWLWTFRESLRRKPCIILADDHDILQGNLWGNSGNGSAGPTEEDGGYKYDKALVRMVYRIQCGHNPDSYDPAPIRHDIPVSYGRFVYGGTSFAFIEDRKWKTPPNANKDVPLTQTRGDLLGPRQEAFLAAWKDMDAGLPKICLTASIWGSPQTDKDLAPLVDYDANGYPPDGRLRGVQLLREANAIALAGDQHLGMVARQGIDDYEDGPVFFAGPAGAAFWQRWFEGRGQLDHPYNDNPDTGNFIDCFGNKMRVMAVANPKMTHTDFLNAKQGWGYFVGDSDLKREGYGIVSVDHAAQSFTFECWSWDAVIGQDPQFAGWPIRISFDKAGRA